MIQVNILATTNEGQLSQKQARYSVAFCNNQVVSIPSERTLRDYRHFASSTPGFSRDVDLQLLDLVKVQEPADLANYVSVIIDEMYIKEGLVFDNTISLTGNCSGTKRKNYNLENPYFEMPLKKRKRRFSQ